MSDRPVPPDLEVELPMPSGLSVPAGQPYQILLIGDFAAGARGSLRGPLAEGMVEVNATNFDDVMRAAVPSVSDTTANPLGGGAMVEIALSFDSIRLFEPSEIAARLPATKSLAAFRDKLVARLHGKAPASSVADAIRSDASLSWAADTMKWTPGSAPAAPAGAVDSVLSQIDLGDGVDTPAPKSPMAAAIAAAAGAGAALPPEETSAVRRTLAEVDKKLTAWLAAVLHHPAVQSLESAWRGLAFLIAHIDFRTGVRLRVLHAPRDKMLERLRTLVIDPVFDQGVDAPDLIVADYAFGNSADDIETLDELAQHGASVPAVVFAPISAGFFGVKHAWQIPTLPALVSMFDQWQFAKWKTLRSQMYARSLAVFFGKALLRAPHGGDSRAEMDFVFREPINGDADGLWASGAIAAACAASRSVATLGWPTAMAGYVHGRIEGFASGHYGAKGEKKIGPTDTMMPLPKIQELAVAGLNAAVGIKDHDDAIVWNGLTAARPANFEQQGVLEISLPYQLFAARLAQLLFILKPRLHDMDGEKAGEFIRQHVADWLTVPGEPQPEQIAVQTRAPEGNPAGLEFALTVTPPQRILPGAIPMVLGYRIR